MMRIVIDLQACQSASRHRGIGRYADAMAKAMVRNAGPHEIRLVLNAYEAENIPTVRAAFKHLMPPDQITVFSVPGPVAGGSPDNAWRSRAAELVRWHALAELKPDIVFVLSLFEGLHENFTTSIESIAIGARNAVTLHDLIPLKNQTAHLVTPIQRDWYFNKLESLKRADKLLANSEYTRRDAMDLLGIPEKNIINISEGVSDIFLPLQLSDSESRRMLSAYGITRPFLLYTGNLDPNKNLNGTIKAYAALPYELRRLHQLVIISQMTADRLLWFNRFCKKCGLKGDDVVFTGYVSDEDLVRFYNLCKLFVFPSLYEGFGLPALEAMACGAACIGSNTTSIPEVIGRKDALFDPTRPEMIAKAMHTVLMDEDFRKSLQKHARIQSAKFSWDASAKQALMIFEEMHAQKNDCSGRAQHLSENAASSEKQSYRRLINRIARINAPVTPLDQDLRQVADSIARNEIVPGKKQLLVDVSVIVERDAKTGIQRVVRSILNHLFDMPDLGYDLRPVYGDQQIGLFRYADELRRDMQGIPDPREADSLVHFRQGDIFLGLDLSAHLFPMFTPPLVDFRAYGVSVFFIIYDIFPLLQRKWFVPGMHEAFKAWMTAISCHADGLICISAAVADQVRSWLDQHPPQRPDEIQIRHFHLGADIENSIPTTGLPENAEQLLSQFSSNPTFLMVGTIEPRKGHAHVLDGFEHLWKTGSRANLVIVGKDGWNMNAFVKRLNEHDQRDHQLFWLQNISDEFLNRLYQSCSALIAGSEAEGFGLPLIEAAQHKLPIIARDIPVFREVAGTHAYYYDSADPEAFASAVTQWLELYKIEKAPKSDNMPWLTWKQSTEMLMDTILPKDIFSDTDIELDN